MKTWVEEGICEWWDGPCLFEAFDAVEVPLQDPEGPLRYFSFADLLASSCLCFLPLYFQLSAL